MAIGGTSWVLCTAIFNLRFLSNILWVRMSSFPKAAIIGPLGLCLKLRTDIIKKSKYARWLRCISLVFAACHEGPIVWTRFWFEEVVTYREPHFSASLYSLIFDALWCVALSSRDFCYLELCFRWRQFIIIFDSILERYQLSCTHCLEILRVVCNICSSPSVLEIDWHWCSLRTISAVCLFVMQDQWSENGHYK